MKGGGALLQRYGVIDVCPAKNGICPSKSRFGWTKRPALAGKLFEALIVLTIQAIYWHKFCLFDFSTDMANL